MRAKEHFLIAIAAMMMGAGAAQGQVDSPVGEAAEGSKSTAAAPRYSAPEYKVVATKLPYKVEYQFSRTVGAGRLRTARSGQPGRIEKVYKVRYQNGKAVSKVLVDTRKIPAVNELVLMGRSGYDSSRHSFTRTKILTMKATAYDPSAGRGSRATFRTASGLRAQYGVVAVDTRVIPMGTKLYIEGYGFAVAADRGSAIKGSRIDLCYNRRSQCIAFGRRTVRVHVLS